MQKLDWYISTKHIYVSDEYNIWKSPLGNYKKNKIIIIINIYHIKLNLPFQSVVELSVPEIEEDHNQIYNFHHNGIDKDAQVSINKFLIQSKDVSNTQPF